MEGLTEKQKQNLMFLRSLDRIIIPKEFTYWCHNTMYKPIEDCVTASDRRCWNEIPTQSFILTKDMSFVSRTQRVNSALDYGNEVSTSYANAPHSWPFQIRVLQPKHEFVKFLYEDRKVQREHYFWERGLGDGRHPKIPAKEELYVFNFAETDDVSDQTIDIVYCLCKEDISLVADLVRKLTEIRNPPINTNLVIEDNRAYERNVATVIERSFNKSRFFDSKILGANRDVQLIKPAGYKEDYKKMKTNKR